MFLLHKFQLKIAKLYARESLNDAFGLLIFPQS